MSKIKNQYRKAKHFKLDDEGHVNDEFSGTQKHPVHESCLKMHGSLYDAYWKPLQRFVASFKDNPIAHSQRRLERRVASLNPFVQYWIKERLAWQAMLFKGDTCYKV